MKAGKGLGAQLLVILAFLSARRMIDAITAPPSSRTPQIAHYKRPHRYRPHAPNDGRWHMKFHRSRA